MITNAFKIVTKVLENRLRDVLSFTISQSKNAFVEGRQNLDVALVANEVVGEARKRRVLVVKLTIG